MYNQKVTSWNHQTDVVVYAVPIIPKSELEDREKLPDGNPVARKKYKDMTEAEKKISDTRRERYFQNRIHYLTNLAIHNNLDTFITLTFRENITDYEEAKKCWQLFLKRFKYNFGNDLKYIAVHELQKRRGVFHFHMQTNTGFIDVKDLSDIWQYGFVFIKTLSSNHESESISEKKTPAHRNPTQEEIARVIRYQLKYITKDIMTEIESKERSSARKIYTSRNLVKPDVIKTLSGETADEIIFSNMENVINTASYDVRNHQGAKINEADVIQIKK